MVSRGRDDVNKIHLKSFLLSTHIDNLGRSMGLPFRLVFILCPRDGPRKAGGGGSEEGRVEEATVL